MSIQDLGAMELRLTSKSTPDESRQWNEYIHRYHYLGHKPLPGAQMRYTVKANGQTIALLGFGAAAWKTAPRDRFIGWTHEQRLRNLHLVVNNARFLILPWVRVPHLASKILALAAKGLARDWENKYKYRPVLLETFVETDRFSGICYKAANWQLHGYTKGRGKLDSFHRNDKPIKSVWTYPLHKKALSILCT